jgi:DNA/RNA endonuclease YhcR with UshA esterase domain
VARAKIFLLFSFSFVLFIFLFGKIEAANQDIIITEIMYDLPGNDEGREWIELYNKGTEEVTILGGSTSNSWRFFDGTSNRILSSTPYQGSLTIKPGEYVILVQDPLKFKEDYPDFPDSITIIQVSAMSLKNTSNTIGLRIGSQGDLWSQVSYDQTLGANGNGKSLERLGTTDSFLESLVERGTPGKENSVNSAQNQPTPTPTPTFSPSPTPTPSFEYFPSDVVINEFLPDPPDGEEEWIELYNNTQKEIDLTGWYIEEGSGAQTFLSGKILPRGFFVVEKIKGYLNNSGDIIFLKDKTGNVIDKVTYGNFDDGNIEDNAPTAKDPYSIARVFDGKDTDEDNLDFKISNSTKGATNQVLGSISFVSNIIINEILPNPKGDDSENEFIELKNLNNFDVDLENWYLQDLSNTKFVLSSKKISTKIPKNGFLVIYRKDSKIALNNVDKDCLKLFQPDGTLVDSVCYSGKVLEDVSFAKTQKGDFEWTEKLTPGTENIILKPNSPPTAQISANKEKAFVGEEVIFDGSDSFDPDGDELEFLWDFGDGKTAQGIIVSHSFSKAKNYKVTLEVKDKRGASDKANLKIEILKKENPTLSNFSSQVFISELLPNPKGRDDEEFIEIFNGGEKEIDLSGWYFKKERSGYKIPDGTKILPGQYLVFWKKDTKITLVNKSDEISLFDGEDNLVDSISYQNAPEGFSFAKNEDGEFEWTKILTPGAKNQFLSTEISNLTKTEILEVEISKIKDFENDQLVKTKGIVLVEPGILGKQIFYIGEPGIQIFYSKGDFPILELGDFVEVTGEISQIRGEKRIKISQKDAIKILGKKQAPAPKEIQIEEIGDFEGDLVLVQGQILERKSNYFILDDGTGRAKVYIKSSTNIKPPKLKEGDKVKVAGIVNEYNSEYRILPRYLTDIEKIEPQNQLSASLFSPSENLPKSKDFLKILGIAFIFSFASAIFYFFLKKKILKKVEF